MLSPGSYSMAIKLVSATHLGGISAAIPFDWILSLQLLRADSIVDMDSADNYRHPFLVELMFPWNRAV